jgi:hypothetical protein
VLSAQQAYSRELEALRRAAKALLEGRLAGTGDGGAGQGGRETCLALPTFLQGPHHIEGAAQRFSSQPAHGPPAAPVASARPGALHSSHAGEAPPGGRGAPAGPNRGLEKGALRCLGSADRIECVIGAKSGRSPLAHVAREHCRFNLAQVHHDQPVQGVGEIPVQIEAE